MVNKASQAVVTHSFENLCRFIHPSRPLPAATWWASTLLLVGMLLSLGGCGGNSDSNGSKTPPPANLAYAQTNISATVGQAITPNAPTVTGTVTSFNVAPALPAGLTLDAGSGVISGTPTAASAQTSYVVTAQNSAGSATTTVQISVKIQAPATLAYSQSSYTATLGAAFSTGVPTYTGTVTSWRVSPTLPAGLSLGAAGDISGTATAVSSQTSYTVTAQNSTGSVTAALQIAVTPPPPSSLVYPQATVTAIAGRSMMTDVPTLTGTASSFTVSPALPAGLTLDQATGALWGIPTTASAQANYTITAHNSGGITTAQVAVSVLPTPTTLLDLGHGAEIMTLEFAANRFVSADTSGHWVLWDYAAGTPIANGPLLVWNGTLDIAELAGTTLAIGVPNGLEIRSAVDGHLLSIISYPGLNVLSGGFLRNPPLAWWKLASDGSYVCIGSFNSLMVVSLAGVVTATRTGDYYRAKVFAAPAKMLVASGPAGASVIETVSVSDGTSTVGPAFNGTFNSWFLDGSRFLTNLGNNVWVYGEDSTQQSIVNLPTTRGLTGRGNWIWTYDGTVVDNPLSVYPIGSSTPALIVNPGPRANVIPSGSTIGVLGTGLTIIDLDAATPTATDVTDVGYLVSYAGASASQWVVSAAGVLVDGPSSIAGTPRYFTLGEAWSIAGSSNNLAVSTPQKILLLAPPSATTVNTLAFWSKKLQFLENGTILGASGASLNFYSIPSGTLLQSYLYLPGTYLIDYSTASAASIIGQVLSGPYTSKTRTVTPLAGGAVIWTDSGSTNPILLSPDGSLLAVYTDDPITDPPTSVYQNGVLISALNGLAVGWIDNSRLLVNHYRHDDSYSTYLGCTIYGPTGAVIAQPPLPDIKSFQPITPDLIYVPEKNAIYSLSTGQAVWNGTYSSTGPGAVSGSYVVYAFGHEVVIETHP